MNKRMIFCKETFDAIGERFRAAKIQQVDEVVITQGEMLQAFQYWLYKMTDKGREESSDKDFDVWINDLSTHWISDVDAAWQAWQEQQEDIDILRARIALLEESQ